MIDRGIIKWQPFNSCFSSSKILREINDSKNKEIFPELSEDQLNKIEITIKNAFILRIQVNITYYYNGKKLYYNGMISGINNQEKKIYLNNKCIYFKQILDINY